MILRILSVTFDTSVQPWELPRFRGAMAHKVGLEHDWFHNHNNETGGVHMRYPLIQYKLDAWRGKQRPMLLCMNDGVEEAHHYFGQRDWSLRIGAEEHRMTIARLNLDEFHLCTTDTPRTYRLHKWQALNPDNYRIWQNTASLAQRFQLLENALIAHILSFARGVDWEPDIRLEMSLTNMLKEEWIEYKKVKVRAYTVDFSINAALPHYIGLGKGSALGYGVLRKQPRERLVLPRQ